MKHTFAILTLIAAACGGGDSGSAAVGYSYSCYDRTYELEVGATTMLHEWFCRAADLEEKGSGQVDCWQSPRDDYAVESADNPHETLTGCGELELLSRGGETCAVRIDC